METGCANKGGEGFCSGPTIGFASQALMPWAARVVPVTELVVSFRLAKTLLAALFLGQCGFNLQHNSVDVR